MAKFEIELQGTFNDWVRWLDEDIPQMNVTSKLEEALDRVDETTKIAIRAYERYSAIGNNRLGLTVVLLESGGKLWMSAVTTGGSQAMFFKINTFGEESFINAFISKVEDKKLLIREL